MTFLEQKKVKKIPACHRVRVGCKKRGAVLSRTKEHEAANIRSYAFASYSSESTRTKVFLLPKLYSATKESFARNQEIILMARSVAMSNLQAQQVRRLSGHHIDRIPA
jgi:hypothetical protein